MASPTQRTLKWLRSLDRGYQCQVVERWNSHARVRIDLFGWADIVAIGPPFHSHRDSDRVIIGIQCCAGSSHAARKAKAAPLAGPWLDAGGWGYVVSWSKKGERGKRKLWQPRCEAL